MADRRKLQKEVAQLEAEHEMLQVQQEECAAQMQKVSSFTHFSVPCQGDAVML